MGSSRWWRGKKGRRGKSYHDAEEPWEDGKPGFAGGEGAGEFFFFGDAPGRRETCVCWDGFGIKFLDEGLVDKVHQYTNSCTQDTVRIFV